jgi:hypothetical protein
MAIKLKPCPLGVGEDLRNDETFFVCNLVGIEILEEEK